MKKAFPLIAAGILVSALFAQDFQHVVSVINIEIPVRVFKGDLFVDTLTLNDFEVLEDGKPQMIEAVYLVKKTDIQRKEGKTGVAPQVSRQFVLYFEMEDYQPEIDTALDLFFEKVILPGDSLIAITPTGKYHLRGDALANLTKAAVKEQLRAKVRKDIFRGSAEYRTTIQEMYRSLSTLPGNEPDLPLEQKLDNYMMFLSRLESLRRVDEKGLVDFAETLKAMPGQKYVYMFYQKERVPQFNPRGMMMRMLENQDNVNLMLRFMEVFESFNRDVTFNLDLVKKAYADSGITIHFLYLTKTAAVSVPVEIFATAENPSELVMVDKSEDIYSAFSEVAKATGGLTESSANAAAAFQKAVDASENYYLIYYKPKDYQADGRFHELKVNIKGGGYRVMHRAGFIAK